MNTNSRWEKLTWMLFMAGFSDKNLWPFRAGSWILEFGNPAGGRLGIMPHSPNGASATLADALWLADCVAFDHDCPIGVLPAFDRDASGNFSIRDTTAPGSPAQPLVPVGQSCSAEWYWSAVAEALGSAAEMRLGVGVLVLRYFKDGTGLGTDFANRFAGSESMVSMYAMACRQTDVLSEYLCLYRLLESVDSNNGRSFVERTSRDIAAFDFGELFVEDLGYEFQDAFELHRARALSEMSRHSTPQKLSKWLYELRNSIAHGKSDIRFGMSGVDVEDVGRAVSVVKLLARIGIER